MFLPALICVYVCLSVCDHDKQKDCGRICTNFMGMFRGEGEREDQVRVWCFVTIGRGT